MQYNESWLTVWKQKYMWIIRYSQNSILFMCPTKSSEILMMVADLLTSQKKKKNDKAIAESHRECIVFNTICF